MLLGYSAAMRLQPIILSGFVSTALLAIPAAAQDLLELKKALSDTVSDGWIYEDIEAGYAEAKKTGKPLLVSFR